MYIPICGNQSLQLVSEDSLRRRMHVWQVERQRWSSYVANSLLPYCQLLQRSWTQCSRLRRLYGSDVIDSASQTRCHLSVLGKPYHNGQLRSTDCLRQGGSAFVSGLSFVCKQEYEKAICDCSWIFITCLIMYLFIYLFFYTLGCIVPKG